MTRSAAVGLALLALVLAGCTGSRSAARTAVTQTQTVTHTRSAPPVAFTPAPATSVHPLPAGAAPRKGETERACPYIKAGLNQQPTSGPNVADLEGDRVYRTTVLTGRQPVGCRFYFAYADHDAVADILPTSFRTAEAAHNAMVLTARAGRHQIGEPGFVPGVDGIRFQTRFYGPDGGNDWAFVFAKGRVMVVVHTRQTNTSFNAQALGQAIVGKF